MTLVKGGPSDDHKTFIGLTDTPSNYTDDGGKALRVNATEDEIEFYTATSTDEKVGIDSGATPDYIGSTSSDGALRASSPITYIDGGNYITLGIDETAVDHDNLLNFVEAEHIDWSATGAEDIHDDRIAASSITQHEGSIDHNSLVNTHNLTTDIDHNSITNAHNLTTDIDHDQLTNFETNEHFTEASIDHSAIDNLDYASANHTGFEPTVTKGNLTEATSDVLTIVGGTGAIIGSGVTIEIDQADAANDGYLSSADWNTFNGKSDTDEKVKVDSGATASYIGAASNDGVIRTGNALDYNDGGDYVTIDVATDGIDDTHIDWGTGANQVASDDMPIGTPTDTDWSDGVFSWATSTLTADALDNLNELLTSLVPPPAPSMYDVSIVDSGTAGQIAWGSSHAIATYTDVGADAGEAALDVNDTFPNSGQRKGVFNDSTTINGVLNDDVSAHAYSYPANAFGSADQGTLKLEVNGSNIHTEDLSTFGSGSTVNGNGSGFNLSASTSCEFENGDPFDTFKYRTGTWTIDPADQRNGWNYMKVIHTLTGGDEETNYYEWVVDDDATAVTFASESLASLNMTGSSHLSGVEYHTGGTATYAVTISEHHKNAWKTSGDITHPTTTNCSVSSTSTDNISAPDWEAQDQTLGQTATVDSGRILDADLTVSTRVSTITQGNYTSGGTSGGWELLVDTNIASPGGQSDSAEGFDAEGYRMDSTVDDSQANMQNVNYGSGTQASDFDWDPTESLVGADTGHNDGLLEYNDALRYPIQAPNSGDFSSIADGPAGNPDYSAASGERVYLRYFYDASTHQNFRFNMTVSNTSFVAASNKGSLSGNEVVAELLAPNTTQDSGSNIEFKDMVTAYTDDDSIGCYSSTHGSTVPTSWGATLGSRSTATSGNVIVLKITAPSTWTGNISNISVTFSP